MHPIGTQEHQSFQSALAILLFPEHLGTQFVKSSGHHKDRCHTLRIENI